MTTLFEKANDVYELYLLKGDLETILKELKSELEQAEEGLMKMMTQEDCKQFEYKGVVFNKSEKLVTTVDKDQKKNLIQALKDNGFGDFVKEEVHPSTLKSLIYEQMASNNRTLPTWLTQFVCVEEKPVMTLRKGKVRT